MSWIAKPLENGMIHVMPIDDLRDHGIDGCWCSSQALDDRPDIIVHNALDGREKYERGERKVS